MVNIKILGISTSIRHANTEIAVKWALDGARELPGVETEFLSLAGMTIHPCKNCYWCIGAPKDDPCHGHNDDFNRVWPKMLDPDAFIIGAMVDFQTAGALFHCLKSRLMCMEFSQLGPEALRNKVFGGIAVGGGTYGGTQTALQYMVMWAMQCDMHVVGTGPEHGKVGCGYLGANCSTATDEGSASMRGRGPIKPNTPREMEAVKEDKSGHAQCVHLGYRVAETAKVIKAGFEAVPKKELHWPKGPVVGGAYDFEAKA